MHNKTTILTSTASGSQNTPGEKDAFYGLQVVPELIVSAVLLGLNNRSVFVAGPWGDRLRDHKPRN